MFRKEIAKFINEVAELDWGKGKVTRKNNQKTISEVDKTLIFKEDSKQKQKWNYKTLFLDLFLKINTVASLKWFYENPGSYSVIDFHQRFKLPYPLQDGLSEETEKDAILLALRETDLLDMQDGLYSIAEDGTEYLKYKKIV